MAHQRKVPADLEVVESHVSFCVFKDALDVPAAEGHVEQDFGGGLLGGVGQEVLHFAAQYVAGTISQHSSPGSLSSLGWKRTMRASQTSGPLSVFLT